SCVIHITSAIQSAYMPRLEGYKQSRGRWELSGSDDEAVARVAGAERSKEVEELLPGPILLVEQHVGLLRFWAADDLRSGFDPWAGDVATHIARSNPRAAAVADALYLAGFPHGVGVEASVTRRDINPRIGSEPHRRFDALAILSEGFQIQIFLAAEGFKGHSVSPIGALVNLMRGKSRQAQKKS